jgi:hypothetical protein
MGIGRFIRRGVRGVVKAGGLLPGPVGLGARAVGGLLGRPRRQPIETRGAGGGLINGIPIPSAGGRGFAPSGGDGIPSDIKRIIGGGITGLFGGLGGVAGGAPGFLGGIVQGGRVARGLGFPIDAPPAQGGVPAVVTTDVLPVTVQPTARAPKGFRVHTVTPSTAGLLGMPVGDKVAVRLGSTAARILGVKRSKKPVLSVRDSEALRRAARAKKRVAKIARGSGLHVSMTRPCRTTRKR